MGKGKERASFMLTVGQMMWEVIVFAWCGIGKGNLRPKKRRNWLNGLKEISPRVGPPLVSPAFQFSLVSVEKSEI